MRKAKREITDFDDIVSVMRRCDVCRLALNGVDGTPYVVPLNFGLVVTEGALSLYFHSALEGQKMDLMKRDNRAAFEMDCGHELQYFEDRGYCTFAYESVMGTGRLRMVEGDEKVRGLDAIMDQYHPGRHAHYNPAAIPRTAVYCLDVETVTGKRKQRM